jgi:CRISPR-associated protein Cas2
MYLLIVYDIPCDRRRLAIDKILSSYGVRVNLSVFEVTLKTRSHGDRLREKLLEAMKAEDDSIRIYPLDKTTVVKAEELGSRRAPFVQESGYVF